VHVRKCLNLASAGTTDASFTKRVGQLAVTDPLLDEDLSDLVEVVEECAALPGR